MAGHIQETLVLLVGLVQHSGQACDVFAVVSFPFLGRLVASLGLGLRFPELLFEQSDHVEVDVQRVQF